MRLPDRGQPIRVLVTGECERRFVARRIDTGSVHINGATVQNEAQAPYGGSKASGYGRFDGRAVIDEFTELKWLTIEPSDQPYPF